MSRMPSEHEWPSIYIAIVALGTLAFLFSVKAILSPVVAFIVLIVLISPWAGTRLHLLTLMSASFLLIIWLLDTLGALLAPFILAFVLAYILNPLVDRLQKRGIRRGLAVAIVVVPGFIAAILLAVLGVPALIQQIEHLIEFLPTALQRAVASLQGLRARLVASHLPFLNGEAIAQALDSFSPERVAQYVNEQQAVIAHRLWGAFVGVGRGLTIALSILGYVVLTPVLTIYLLGSFEQLIARAAELIPRNKRDTWIPFIQEYNQLLSGYLRGQILEAIIVGILTWIGLMVLGFPYAGVVAVFAGVFNLVPYLGLVVSLIPGIIIALLSGDIVASLLKLAGVFVVVQAIDGTITGPRIVGGSVGLHPVWVILALAVGSFFFGFVGLLLAMPVAVLIKLLVRDAVARYEQSRVYLGKTLPAER